jgi:8-hydroxy-5-deazaflavin:NADPH oxidoreductase
MNVVIIGSGNMGSALAARLVGAGHKVSIVSKDPSHAAALAQKVGARAVPAATAGRDADAVIVATPYADAVAALRALGDLNGKPVVDITNPLTADYMSLAIGHTTSAAEEIAKAVPATEVVKAFNTVFAQVLQDGGDLGNGNRASVFYAGDSVRAKQTVETLIESIGFEPVDAGPLRNARYLEPLAGLNIYFGYGAGKGTSIAPAWIARA